MGGDLVADFQVDLGHSAEQGFRKHATVGRLCQQTAILHIGSRLPSAGQGIKFLARWAGVASEPKIVTVVWVVPKATRGKASNDQRFRWNSNFIPRSTR